jgi:hypothetical protein
LLPFSMQLLSFPEGRVYSGKPQLGLFLERDFQRTGRSSQRRGAISSRCLSSICVNAMVSSTAGGGSALTLCIISTPGWAFFFGDSGFLLGPRILQTGSSQSGLSILSRHGGEFHGGASPFLRSVPSVFSEGRRGPYDRKLSWSFFGVLR